MIVFISPLEGIISVVIIERSTSGVHGKEHSHMVCKYAHWQYTLASIVVCDIVLEDHNSVAAH